MDPIFSFKKWPLWVTSFWPLPPSRGNRIFYILFFEFLGAWDGAETMLNWFNSFSCVYKWLIQFYLARLLGALAPKCCCQRCFHWPTRSNWRSWFNSPTRLTWPTWLNYPNHWNRPTRLNWSIRFNWPTGWNRSSRLHWSIPFTWPTWLMPESLKSADSINWPNGWNGSTLDSGISPYHLQLVTKPISVNRLARLPWIGWLAPISSTWPIRLICPNRWNRSSWPTCWNSRTRLK